MKVAIIGTGHVGLVTGVALASLGHEVIGTDADLARIEALSRGVLPFSEPGLDQLFQQGVDAGLLSFAETTADAVRDAEVVMVCVGRPPVGLGDKSLAAVESAVREVARHAPHGVVLVIKSTVPPGTTSRVAHLFAMERPDIDFSVVSSPEFLREGHAVEDTLRPERLVVGSDSSQGLDAMRRLYAPMIAQGVRLIETAPASAELSKLASNSFLALKISFANALARISELSGADVEEVVEIVGADSRIGRAFLGAGMGYGGYCLPKDIVTMEKMSARLGYDFGMLREASKINAESIQAVRARVEEVVWQLEGKRVALLGLAFKAGTDDVRGAPALELARLLAADGADVVGWDPMAGEHARKEMPDLLLAETPLAAAAEASCVVVCTEWPEIAELDLSSLKSVMAYPAIVDGRNVIDGKAAVDAGFHFRSVGRGGEVTR